MCNFLVSSCDQSWRRFTLKELKKMYFKSHWVVLKSKTLLSLKRRDLEAHEFIWKGPSRCEAPTQKGTSCFCSVQLILDLHWNTKVYKAASDSVWSWVNSVEEMAKHRWRPAVLGLTTVRSRRSDVSSGFPLDAVPLLCPLWLLHFIFQQTLMMKEQGGKEMT